MKELPCWEEYQEMQDYLVLPATWPKYSRCIYRKDTLPESSSSQPKPIEEFTRIQFRENKNRRGLGFDKPYIDNHKNKLKDAYPAVSASKNSFGHTGYTGTMAWADPDSGVLFIFMSNRVHPTRENSQLFNLNIRPAMHQAIYDSILGPEI
jgi:CubicO group peptidase (beta-lactamase class C family)